ELPVHYERFFGGNGGFDLGRRIHRHIAEVQNLALKINAARHQTDDRHNYSFRKCFYDRVERGTDHALDSQVTHVSAGDKSLEIIPHRSASCYSSRSFFAFGNYREPLIKTNGTY